MRIEFNMLQKPLTPWKQSKGGSKGQKGKDNGQERSQGKGVAKFPSYDQKKLGREIIQEVDTRRVTETDPLITELQKAVNGARRAEGKIRKIVQEKAERQSQWRIWVADLKASYAKEKQRFQLAIDKLDREHANAIEEQHKASVQLRAVASGSGQMEVEPDVQESHFGEFEALIATVEPEHLEPADSHTVWAIV